MMSDEEKHFRAKFNKLLEPVKVMLVHRQGELSSGEWLSFVEQTRLSVVGHPDEYLGKELPKKFVIEFIVSKIFTDFIKRQEK